jgi:hypothetical protein
MTKVNANSESRGMQVRAHRQHHTARQTNRQSTDRQQAHCHRAQVVYRTGHITTTNSIA